MFTLCLKECLHRVWRHFYTMFYGMFTLCWKTCIYFLKKKLYCVWKYVYTIIENMYEYMLTQYLTHICIWFEDMFTQCLQLCLLKIVQILGCLKWSKTIEYGPKYFQIYLDWKFLNRNGVQEILTLFKSYKPLYKSFGCSTDKLCHKAECVQDHLRLSSIKGCLPLKVVYLKVCIPPPTTYICPPS